MQQTDDQASTCVRADAQAEELFEREAHEHIDADTLQHALDWLLERHPHAPVAALKADGILVAMPASIELRSNPVLEARSGLDLVVEQDRVRVLGSWDRVLAGGAARCLVHLATNPQETVTLHGLDLRERHGAVLVLFVSAGAPVGHAEPSSPGGANGAACREAPEPTPRFATIAKDERSFIVEVDEAITKILGWRPEEMTGHRSIEFIHPDDHSLAIDNWMEMLSTPGMGRRVRLRHRRRDGSWVWFEITNHNLLDQPQRRVISDIVDISEEMAAHEALRAREQLLDRLASAIPLGLFQIDAARQIVYTNKRLHEILGVARAEDVRGQLASVAVEHRSRIEHALEQVLGGGEPQEVELELALPGRRERRLCAVSLRALTHENGAVSGAIACVADVTDSARMRDELERRATFDELTGCYNRASIMRALQADIAERGSQGERAVMFVDLDRFKEVNDRHGHPAGDELLRVLAARLRAAVRERDLVGRIGGDEFLVVCPDVGGADCAMTLAARLSESLRQEVALQGARVRPSVSIGVAHSRGQTLSGEALVAQADGAMYDIKRRGLPAPAHASAASALTPSGGLRAGARARASRGA